MQVSDRAFGELRSRGVPEILLPAGGGLVTGLIALADPEVLFQGWGNVNGVLDAAKGEFSPLALAQIVALKVLFLLLLVLLHCRRTCMAGQQDLPFGSSVTGDLLHVPVLQVCTNAPHQGVADTSACCRCWPPLSAGALGLLAACMRPPSLWVSPDPKHVLVPSPAF